MKRVEPLTAAVAVGLLATTLGCSSGPSAQQVAAAQAAAVRQQAVGAENARRAAILAKAAGGSPSDQFDAGVYVYKTGIRGNPNSIAERDFQETRTWFERAAAQGHVAATHNLGVLAWNIGDFASAVKWLEQSAAKQFRPSHFVLGIMYWNAQGVRQDVRRAVAYVTEGANGAEEAAIVRIMKRSAESVQGMPDTNPALPGQGSFVIQNDGRTIRVRINPSSFNITER